MTKKKNVKKPISGKRSRLQSGDVITINDVGDGSAVAAGRGASAQVVSKTSSDSIQAWMLSIDKKIDGLTISLDEKNDLKQQVEKIADEIQKGEKAEKSRLEKLINTISVMSSDIFDVVVATIQNPLGGLGMIIKKIGDKVKLEQSKK